MSTQYTPTSNLPYPDGSSAPDGPGAVYPLATALDPMVGPSFASARGRVIPQNTSLNTVFDVGVYSGTNCLYAPEGSLDKFVLQVLPFDSQNAVQTIFLFQDKTMWVRFALGGTWATWKQITLT